MKRKIAGFLFILMIILLNGFLFDLDQAGGAIDIQQTNIEYIQTLVNDLDMSNVQEHIEYLSSLGSRVTGYPGSYEASDYIFEFFDSLGLETWVESYDVMIPVDHGAEIEITSPIFESIEAFPLWPNHLQTCPIPESGIQGRVIYGGNGSLTHFDGKKVQDSIVIMDFNSLEWKNAWLLGAKAIIFIEPFETTRIIAQNMLLGIPYNIPRLYVSREDGEFLLSLLDDGELVEASLSSQMRWEIQEGRNVIALLKGQNQDKNTFGLVGYFDSTSVVPSISPGASDAVSVASLMEIARVFRDNPPLQNILFVAVSGHYQGLAGSRSFIDNNFDMLAKVGSHPEINILMFASVDISSESDVITVRTGEDLGYTYNYGAIEFFDRGYLNLRQRIIQNYIRELEDATGKDYELINLWTQEISFTPNPIINDAEPFAIACGGGGISFYTMNSIRALSGTPIDTEDKIVYQNIEPQIELTLGFTASITSDEFLVARSALSPQRFTSIGWGFASFDAKTWEYQPTVGWYDDIPDIIVQVTSQIFTSNTEIGLPPIGSTIMPSGFNAIYLSDQNGDLRISGLQPMADYQIKAFKIDSQTGEITHSNDISSFRGSGQGGVFSNPFRVYRSDFWLRIPVFECGSITLTKMLDPRSMVSFTQAEASSMMVWEFYSHVPPLQFGPTIVSREDVMTFVPPETPLQIKVSLGNTLVSVVSNSSDEFPFGTGYTLESGESLFLSNTPFVLLDNFFRIVDERFITLTSTGVTYSATADLYHGSSAELRLNALNALNNYIYSEAYSGIYQALAFEMSGYDATMQLFFDAIYTVVFFFLLLIPFSYLIERLILTRKGAALRMFTITAIFAAFTLVLYFLHPGFHLATSVYMIVIGFLLAIMAVISLGVIFLTGSGFFKEIRIGYLGPHFSEIARTSAVATALSVGVNNMKRHKLRTILNLITIVMIVFSMISFVSLELLSVIKVFKSPIPPGYEGTLLKGFDVLDTVSSAIPETLSYALGDDVVVSRIWVYPPNLVLPIRGPKGTYEANALLGLEWIEKEFNPVNATIIQGRWFTSFDKYGAIIPKTLIDRSGIEFKDRLINIWGIDFTIVGVFDPNVFDSLTDLDDRTINPIDMFSAIAYGQPVPLSSRDFIIIPAETAKELGGEVRSVAFLKKEGIDLTEFTNDLALQFGGLSVIVGDEGETRQISAGQVTNLLGGNITFPAIGIAMLVLLTTLLGGVVERKREIFVYNVVGLAPRHIQWIFLAEPLIYAIVGASLGYLFGIGGTSILSALNLLPIGFHPNYSAQWVMIAVTASMGIVFVPSLYPNRIVSKTASPTSMRAWKIPTKPVGDIWSIPLPFVENIGQIGGLFSFINEYLGAYRYERAGTFQATQLSYEEKEKSRALKFFTKLIPWDTPSTQWTTIIATTKDGEKFNFELLVVRDSGYLHLWKASNQLFLDRIRMQFLIWRALDPSRKEKYLKNWNKVRSEME